MIFLSWNKRLLLISFFPSLCAGFMTNFPLLLSLPLSLSLQLELLLWYDFIIGLWFPQGTLDKLHFHIFIRMLEPSENPKIKGFVRGQKTSRNASKWPKSGRKTSCRYNDEFIFFIFFYFFLQKCIRKHSRGQICFVISGWSNVWLKQCHEKVHFVFCHLDWSSH